MQKSTDSHLSSEVLDAVKSATDSAQAIRDILAEMIGKLQKINSESLAVNFGDSMLSLFHVFEPGGVSNSLWQFPSWYQSRAVHSIQSMLEASDVLNQSHRQFIELMGGSLTQFSERTTQTIAQVNESLFSRRVSAEVFDFPDRRAAASTESNTNHEAQVKTASVPRSSKKSTA